MDVGNPKQAAALGVIALGALGYLGMRLIGPMFQRTVKGLAATDRKAPEASTAVHPKYLPVSDPFSHPRLAVMVKTNQGDGSTPILPMVTGGPRGVLYGDIQSPIGAAASDSSNGIDSKPASSNGDRSTSDDPLTQSIKGAGGGKKAAFSAETPKVTVGLEAIVAASDPVAFLIVDGKSSEPYRLNQWITKEIRLEKIGDGSVVLKLPKGRLTLNVGEQKRL